MKRDVSRLKEPAGQFDSRSSQANPQLWFQRNVSIGDSPTMVATTNHFPLTCCVKGETIDLIKVDGCLVSIGVSLSFLLFGRWAVKSWSCQVYCSADYNTLNSPSEPIQSRFHSKLKFSMKCVCVWHTVCASMRVSIKGSIIAHRVEWECDLPLVTVDLWACKGGSTPLTFQSAPMNWLFDLNQ